jgi:uncharacterized membrane protein YczE
LRFHIASNAPAETRVSAISVVAAYCGADIRRHDRFRRFLHKIRDGGQLPGTMGLCIIGIILVGIGVSLEVEANFTVVAGEGLVLAITKVLHTKFGNTKIIFDVTLVLIAAVLSFFFLGKITGVREGTLAAALLVGQISKLCLKHYGKLGKWINA